MTYFIESDTHSEPLGAQSFREAVEAFRAECMDENCALSLVEDGTVLFTYNGLQSEPYRRIVDHTEVTGYHFKGKLWCAHHLVGALLGAGELSPAARDMDPEEVLDQLAETYPDIDRDDEDSFSEAEFPKRHRRSMGPVFCES